MLPMKGWQVILEIGRFVVDAIAVVVVATLDFAMANVEVASLVTYFLD